MSKRWLVLLCLGGIMSLTLSSAANFIGAQQQRLNGQLQVTPQYEMNISDKVKEAIDNGIVITFVLQGKMFRSVDWWFDQALQSQFHTYQVRYFSLSSLYQLHHIRTDEKLSFVTLDELLVYLGQEISFTFKYDQQANYIETRLFLDKQALPSIMQLPNVFDGDWNFNSDWQTIVIDVTESP